MDNWKASTDPELLSTEEIDKILDEQLELIKETFNNIECEIGNRFSFKPTKTSSLYSPYTATPVSYTPLKEDMKKNMILFLETYMKRSRNSLSQNFSQTGGKR